MTVPEQLLDDPGGLEAGDPGGMLRAVASSAAQVREAVVLAEEAGLEQLAQLGRPRAVVVAGMGGSGIAGDLLAAAAGPACPVPVLTHRGYGLPGWVGAADLVVAVSCSGTTAETLSALEEAGRRGCPVLAVTAPGSPVEDLARRSRGVVVAVPQGRAPRASVWALTIPLVVAADVLGLMAAGPELLEQVAVGLEGVAARCRVDADTLVNPAKTLALELIDRLPVVWGTSPVGSAAAYRFACQLNENAELPCVWGTLPEAGHNQVVALGAPAAERDIFADPDESGAGSSGMRLLLLRTPDEHPEVARRAEVVGEIAGARGLPVTSLLAEGESALEQLAFLVGLGDFASVYRALATGVDPTPVTAIVELKSRLASSG